MVGVVTAQGVDVQRDPGMIDQALEELTHQVDIEFADGCAREGHVEDQARPPGQIHHHARQGFVERHIGMAVTAQALLVAQRLGERLADGDADILDGVMRVDVQIALRLDVQVDHAVARDLVQHVVEETDAGGEFGDAGAVEIEGDADFCFQGIARYFGLPHGGDDQAKGRGLHDTIGLAGCTPQPNLDHHHPTCHSA